MSATSLNNTPLGRLNGVAYLKTASYLGGSSSFTNMFQQVRQLLDLITKSVDTLEQSCSERKIELPSLAEPFQFSQLALWGDPTAAEAVAVISAAASHLNAIVSPPKDVINSITTGVSPIDLHHY